MKRNRLNHFADAIIGILNGWRVVADAEALKRNEAGIYRIDLLRKTVIFNGKAITLPPVFYYLFEWFENETKNNTNPEAVLTVAKVIFTVEEKSESDPYYLEYGVFGFTLYKKRVQTYRRETAIEVILKTASHDYSKKAYGVIF